MDVRRLTLVLGLSVRIMPVIILFVSLVMSLPIIKMFASHPSAVFMPLMYMPAAGSVDNDNINIRSIRYIVVIVVWIRHRYRGRIIDGFFIRDRRIIIRRIVIRGSIGVIGVLLDGNAGKHQNRNNG
jgi:hypothetical protein